MKYTMKSVKLILLIALPILLSSSLHKFYVSVTQIEYNAEQESVRITSRIFIDDFERALRERYDETIVLKNVGELPMVDLYTEGYLKEKLTIQIDGISRELKFNGRNSEDDIMFANLEIEDVKDINLIEIGNEVLFELFEDQQNIIRTSIKGKKKSFILVKENAIGRLNFD